MATDKYPQRNHNMPMQEGALAGARARMLDPGVAGSVSNQPPVNGKGSRREVRAGEWVDDRVIVIGGPASPSDGEPPAMKGMDGRSLPTFTAGKVYQVTLGKACMFAGRMLSPSMAFQMTGDTCLDPAVQPCILEATEIGDVPVDPDVAPSAAKKKA
jgi:hypothetical protein